MIEINFSVDEEFLDVIPHPVPAKKMVPKWYKNMSQYVQKDKPHPMILDEDDGKSIVNLTMKACIPIRDTLLSGYIIPLVSDLRAFHSSEEQGWTFHWSPRYDYHLNELISTHSVDQIKKSPLEKLSSNGTLFKLHNPWRIKTKPGYSCMFYSLPYHDHPFEILPGIVDTDGIHEVNFPFVWKPESGEYMLKKGLPFAYVLPFKREEYKHTVTKSDKKVLDNRRISATHMGFWYRDFVHKKKKYD